MSSEIDFALLAPVPLVHLESAEEVLRTQPYVSFGSMKYELFRSIDEERKGKSVPALIYSSHDENHAELTYKVAWVGWYEGSVDDIASKQEDEQRGRRPPSTVRFPKDNALGWAVFWRVSRLVRLSAGDVREIRDLNNFRSGNARKNAPPRGPERIAVPFGIPLPK